MRRSSVVLRTWKGCCGLRRVGGHGRPRAGAIRLVDDAILRARRQYLQRLQELDQRVALRRRQRLERASRFARFAAVREHRLAQRGEETVMKKWRLVGGAPQ